MKVGNEVTMTNFRGVINAGGIFYKLNSYVNKEAGAFSVHAFNKDDEVKGVSFKSNQNNKVVAIGLSNKDKSQGLKDIDYAIYLEKEPKSIVKIYEKGELKKTSDEFSTGDEMKVMINDKGKVI